MAHAMPRRQEHAAAENKALRCLCHAHADAVDITPIALTLLLLTALMLLSRRLPIDYRSIGFGHIISRA